MVEPWPMDLCAPSFDRALASLRAELAGEERTDGLWVAVEQRLRELREEWEATPDLVDPVHVAVHVVDDAVAVEISSGPSRDWFQRS